ncbi:MAG: sigma-54-dependent Fis family transcriptional regulator [Candidatus Aminicenantes bacterium]|nr:sigma-54-dependent Fis family transcriptional regulator [Candidatus Aminicenantes bacterium]
MKIIALDPLSKKLLKKAEKIAPTRLPVYLWGESGSGKDTLAEYIHRKSGVDGKMIKIGNFNISAQLVDSQIFGHRKGAFSDAFEDRDGFIALANNGTLYLDLLDEIPIDVQKKIFPVLESGEFYPLGSESLKKVNLRILASGELPLEEAVRTGRIIEKFLHFFTFSLHVPPLRERKKDILPLIKEFSNGKLKISSDVKEKIMEYPWWGNIRELKNFVEREISLGKDEISPPEPAGTYFEREAEVFFRNFPTLEEFEIWYIKKVLAIFKGNKKKTAEVLGITRSTLYRKLKK